ncbi:S9 family peptidase [Nakamurella lactea]|uniref:S9 family peptidase n=1 Tax=Nakamurella lactea TaxID=459515 RepID=UPI000418BD8A|nr:DPP IV N-terminal domain-containing protein [Nakamurella lactea]
MQDDLLERYRRAASLGPEQLLALMRNRNISPHWTGDGDRFWYRRERETGGHEYALVDPEDFSSRPLFDHQATAARLASLLGTEVDPWQLPIDSYDADPAGGVRVALVDGRIAALREGGDQIDASPKSAVLASPDGAYELFVSDHNLWLRAIGSGEERALTADGEPHWSWGALPDYNVVHIPLLRQGRLLPPVFTGFSPTGRLVVTLRPDERDYPEYPFVEQLPADRARPRTYPIRNLLDDENRRGTPQLAIIEVETGRRVSIDLGEELAATLMSTGLDVLTWGAEDECLYVLAHRVGTGTATLERIDVRTGEQSTVISETADHIYEPNTHLYSLPLIRVLPRTREVIWFSQRDGWGHLYRYDLDTGDCTNAITSGELVVRDILRVDEEQREVYLLAGSGADGHNPYWRKLYRAGLDGGSQLLLTPEPADHEIPARVPQFFGLVFGVPDVTAISPSGRFVIDHMSTVSRAPEIVLRETRHGGLVGTLEKTDVSALLAAGYRPPEQFTVKADDGQTDLWGVLSLPPGLADDERAPVIDLMYAGFQKATQPTSFLGSDLDHRSVQAAVGYGILGFATVVLDGRGTPGRDRVFRQWTQRHPDITRGLADHVTAIRKLAERYPLDLNRVGVTGHSYGGYHSVRSMLLFPDFFKVGVSSAGVHVPQKLPNGMWAWHVGAETPRDSDLYRSLGNLPLVDRLSGKLLLLFGDLDENATPDHTLALVNALMSAGKRFDMKLWPGMDHYRTNTGYIRMITWDYFVENLLGERPPEQFVP